MIETNRFRAAIYGLLLGDAVGVPYEFNPPDRLAAYADRIDMVPPAGFHRTYSVPVGTWSDDGALALCLLESLVERREFDLVDQARRMVAWLDEGHLAVGNHVFDVGNTTRQALHQARSLLASGISPAGRGPTHEHTAGNGSLMRILPLALWHEGPDTDLTRQAMDHSALTHGHPACLVCCAIYCLWARSLAAGTDRPFEAAIENVRTLVNPDPTLAAAIGRVDSSLDREPTGTGFVIDTLISARFVLEQGSGFEDVIRRAILLGNDTDTTAAVAGGLAGLQYGENGLPATWMDLLRSKEVVEAILARGGFGEG